MKKIIFLALLVASMTSCMSTKTTVGTFKEETGNEYVYDKGKQVYLFWGIMPIGRTNVSTPVDGSCEVITKIRLIDLALSACTGGIITIQSVKVKDKRAEK